MREILDQLGLSTVNDGTWLGGDSIADKSANLIESVNPATNEVIASVRSTTKPEYERVISKAQESFLAWRNVPAPARGEAIRNVANALRKYKDPLGSLVALETGKIKVENAADTRWRIA